MDKETKRIVLEFKKQMAIMQEELRRGEILKKKIEPLLNKIREEEIEQATFEFEPGAEYVVVANNLKEKIRRSLYTQRDFAKLIGVNEQTLSNIVNNRFTTSLEIALKISYALKTSVNVLFKLQKVQK